jgi:hypothetical protein
MAKFSNMPGTPLLTQNMLVPDNWMVESIASPHDLDNIKLDQVDANVHRLVIGSRLSVCFIELLFMLILYMFLVSLSLNI